MPKLIREATDAPPGTQPTLREIIQRIYDIENVRDSGQTSQVATDKGQAATIQAISRQISDIAAAQAALAVAQADLTGRSSYNAVDIDSDNSWTSTQGPNLLYGPSVTFSLDRRRVVALSSFVKATLYAGNAGAGSSSGVSLETGVAINGVAGVSGYGTMTPGVLSISYSGPGGSVNNGANLQARALVTMNAGTYTIRPTLYTRAVSTSGSGYAGGNTYQSSIYVDVLQPV